jgi:hypothetical protein
MSRVHPSERAMRWLVRQYQRQELPPSDMVARVSAMFARRQLGVIGMRATLTWYGLKP